MNQSKTMSIDRLITHAEEQKAQRKADAKWTPSEDDVHNREVIMDGILDDLGATPAEIQEMLGVNRTTWERWRRCESIPGRSRLYHLKRVVENGGDSPETRSEPLLPDPLEFLTASPCTYGQLRVLFSHSSYNWQDAVFHFREPFVDMPTVIDMASLALNGCSLVYLLDSKYFPDPVDDNVWWPRDFTRSMVECLGRKVAAQALSNFCFVEISAAEEKNLKEFGLLNFWSKDEKEKVAYIWQPNGNTPENKSERFMNQPDVYTPKKPCDDLFEPLRLDFSEALSIARKAIKENSFDVEYDDDTQKHRFGIPTVRKRDNGYKIERLDIYV